MSPSIAHHPALPLDRFATLVHEAGLRRIAVSAAAVDAFGAIRFRSLTERLGLTVAAVHGHGDPARAALLAGILMLDPGPRPAPRPALAEISAATLDAHRGRLADAVGKIATGASEVHLDPASWRRLAGIA